MEERDVCEDQPAGMIQGLRSQLPELVLPGFIFLRSCSGCLACIVSGFDFRASALFIELRSELA